MIGSNPRVRLVTAAATCIGVIGVAGVALAAATNPASTPTVSEPASTAEASTTTGVPAFADGAEARAAAEELLGAYIESELGVVVTDEACSAPPAGAVGDQFACYALKPDSLVIALRATVGPQRLIELELLFDQPPPTTTPAGQDTATTTG